MNKFHLSPGADCPGRKQLTVGQTGVWGGRPTSEPIAEAFDNVHYEMSIKFHDATVLFSVEDLQKVQT